MARTKQSCRRISTGGLVLRSKPECMVADPAPGSDSDTETDSDRETKRSRLAPQAVAAPLLQSVQRFDSKSVLLDQAGSVVKGRKV